MRLWEKVCFWSSFLVQFAAPFLWSGFLLSLRDNSLILDQGSNLWNDDREESENDGEPRVFPTTTSVNSSGKCVPQTRKGIPSPSVCLRRSLRSVSNQIIETREPFASFKWCHQHVPIPEKETLLHDISIVILQQSSFIHRWWKHTFVHHYLLFQQVVPSPFPLDHLFHLEWQG